MTMIERVARAIQASETVMVEREMDENSRLPDGNDGARYAAMARAAIEAMREPTDAMMIDKGSYVRHPTVKAVVNTTATWTAMIDAALTHP